MTAPQNADLLLTGARVRTFDDAQPWAEAIGVTDGRISYIGPAADAPAARETRDLGGALVTPGIIDSHNHLLLGFDPDAVSLEGAETLEEVRRRIRDLAERRPDLDWICAENAVYSIVPGRRPNAADLAGLTDRPVFVTTYDQHSVWLNDAALRLLGIADGHDIPWGRPERDDAGRPTGWVTDFYTSAMTTAGLAACSATSRSTRPSAATAACSAVSPSPLRPGSPRSWSRRSRSPSSASSTGHASAGCSAPG